MAFLFGLGRSTSASAGPSQSAPSKSAFPQVVEVVPGKLRVKIFLHDVTYQDKTIPCWSYLTDGLLAYHQKELVLTLQRGPGQKPEDYPRDFFDLFANIYQLAGQGRIVDQGEISRFGESGFLGDKNLTGLGYIEPQELPGVDTGVVPLLAVILLKGDEARIASNQGLTRITAMLGMSYRYYPAPPWSELQRKPVISLHDAEASLIGGIVSVALPVSFYQERNHIFLQIPAALRTQVQELFRDVPAGKPVAIRTIVDPRANACLVWRPGQKQPAAITPPGSNGSRITGNFLIFLPDQDANNVRGVEDGFYFAATSKDWQKIREALQSGTDLAIPPGGQNGASLSIEWQTPKAYTSPASGETYVADSWKKYEPQDDSPPAKQRASVKPEKIILLTSQQDLAARTTAEDLAAYVERLEDVADAFFVSLKESTKRSLTAHLDLAQQTHKVIFSAVPELGPDQHASLEKLLNEVPAPKVSGPVKLDLVLNIWDSPPKQ